MRLLLALLLLLSLTSTAPALQFGPVRHCAGARCTAVDLAWLPLQGREATLVRTVNIPPEAFPLERPLMVRIIAMASSEVRWNGIVIGHNGVPGADASQERPGRFVASFIVPGRLLRPGENIVSARMSAHHLWLPVRTPVHQLAVLPYESDALPGLSDYLPALLALGALLGSGIYFSTSALSARGDRGPLLLAAIAVAAMLQLLTEVSRAFVAYPYPLHLARVSAVALLAALTAVLIAGWAARRFAPDLQRPVVLLTAAAAALGTLLLPWFDLKALASIFAGAAALGVCAWRGRKLHGAPARVALAAALAFPALIVWQLTAFLDQAYFVLLAALLVALVAEQVGMLRHAHAERDAERRRSALLAERLARAERDGEAIVALKDGNRTHRIAEGDIVYLRAADDYCEAVMADGRVLLVTMTLSRLLATLPARFVRVHKSYAVNRAHVATVAARAGGGRLLRLTDGSSVPVGRSYGAAVAASIG